jgi:hypothetical protein
VIFLYVIHMSEISSYLYYFHCVLHIPVCPVFPMCCSNVDASLLYFIARVCSLTCILNERPVRPDNPCT